MSKTKKSTRKHSQPTVKWYELSSTELGTLAPASVLTLLGLSSLISSVFRHSFIDWPTATLFTIFGLLLMYRTFKHEMVATYALVVAWILAVITVFAVFAWFSSTAGTCTGLMGAQTSCADVSRLNVAIFILNPFSMALAALATISGIVAALFKVKKMI